MFRVTLQHPGVQPFSGGVLDAWPAYAVDGLAIARTEVERVRSHIQAEAKK